MKYLERCLWIAMGIAFGCVSMLLFGTAPQQALANNDRHEDYIMATGPVLTGPTVFNNFAAIANPGSGGNPGAPGHSGFGGRSPTIVPVPNPTAPNGFSDGIWLLDYRSGMLIGTVVHSQLGKVLNWAKVDLVQEFKIAPKQNVHFLMTTGNQVNGQTALYVAETTTGKFAVYTMGLHPDPRIGVVIRRHDASLFREPIARQ